MNATGNGVLNLTIPREMLDSKRFQVYDSNYLVFEDGKNSSYSEAKAKDNLRSLSINFSNDTKEIQILGNQTGSGFIKYEDAILGTKLYYPSDWIAKDNLTATLGQVVFHPVNDSAKNISFGIAAEILPVKNTTLEQFSVSKLKDAVSIHGEGFTESIPITIGNNSAYKLLYDPTNNESRHYSMYIWTVKDGVGYSILYNADKDMHAKYFPTIMTMLTSLELTHIPKIGIWISFAKNPVTVGEAQNITVITFDPNTMKKIPITKIDLLIRSVSGLPIKTAGYTDESSQFSYLWNLDEGTKVGKFTAKVDASKLGYESSSNTTTFEVIESPIKPDLFVPLLGVPEENVSASKLVNTNVTNSTVTNSTTISSKNDTKTTTFKEINGLRILSENVFQDTSGDIRILGEVQNTLSSDMRYLRVNVAFFDSTGKILGTDYGYAHPNPIKSNQTGSYQITTSKSDLAPGGIYSTKINYEWK